MQTGLRLLVFCLLASVGYASQITIADNANTITNTSSVVSVSISWPEFFAADGTYVAPGRVKPVVANGAFSVQLPSNAGTSAIYTFSFLIAEPLNKTNLLSAQVVLPATATGTVSFAQCIVQAPWYAGSVTIPLANPNPSGGQQQSTTGDARSLLGILLSLNKPTNGQGYLYNVATNQLEPVAMQYWKRYPITFAQFAAMPGNSGTVTLFARANRQKLCGISLYTTSGFVAAGLSGANLVVGDSNGLANQYTPVAASVADNGNQDYNVMGSAIGSGNVTATLSLTGANLSALTSGATDVDVCVINQP